jgi:hypothetical protein
MMTIAVIKIYLLSLLQKSWKCHPERSEGYRNSLII